MSTLVYFYGPRRHAYNEHGEKRCAHCKQWLPLDNFCTNRASWDGKHIYCATCNKKRSREKYYTPEGHAKARELWLKSRYGLTTADFLILHQRQNGQCSVCSRSIPTEGKAVHVDHCHATGKVRGLLCTNCNTLLGLCHENPIVLQSAITYIEQHSL